MIVHFTFVYRNDLLKHILRATHCITINIIIIIQSTIKFFTAFKEEGKRGLEYEVHYNNVNCTFKTKNQSTLG